MNRTTVAPTARQLPRRRRSFAVLGDEAIRELVRPALGDRADAARIERPEQGVNNRTYLIHTDDGGGVAVKMRPHSPRPVRNSPLWPRYTQDLYGVVPNGAISTLVGVTAQLVRQGSIRAPEILLVDVSGDVVAAPYLVAELLPGRPLGWSEERLPAAARLLGDHVGRLHVSTLGSGFGIYSNRSCFPLTHWWSHFARAYARLEDELTRCSPAVADVAPLLDRALARGVASGSPPASALVCLDQSPTHYLGPGDGGISAMVDVEGHLFAPPEYELALLELWVPQRRGLIDGYQRHRLYPSGLLDEVRPAYWLFTWMEWAYCLRTLVHDLDEAANLEVRLQQLARQVV